MNKMLSRRILAGLMYRAFVVVLAGCAAGHGVWHRTEARNLPDELAVKLSVGDSRQKVRQALGEPLLDARKLGVELYRKSGRDIDYDWALIIYVPVVTPHPGQKVIVFVMVAYDEHDLVKEVETDFWIPGHSLGFWISVGGYSFANSYYNEPETILAPPVTWDELSKTPVTDGRCALVLLMGECPMEEIVLDDSKIIDLSPAGGWCASQFEWQRRKENYFYDAFIRKNIVPGNHRLSVRQRTMHGNFETAFECESGRTVYAELKAGNVEPGPIRQSRLQGAISISKNPRERVLDAESFYRILWVL
jgi:hypothetical protein